MKVQCQICEAQWEQTEELDRQALREERQAFGRNAHASQRVVLCDDCYAEFMQVVAGLVRKGAGTDRQRGRCQGAVVNWSLYRMKYPALDLAVILAKAVLVAFVVARLLVGCGDAFGVAGVGDGGGGAVEGGGAADAARDAQGSPLDAGHDAGGPDAAAAEAGGDSSPPDSSPLDVGAPDAPPAETAPTCTPISPQNADTCGQSGNWPEQYVVWIDSSCAGSGDVWYTTPSSCLCLETYDCACVLAADPHFGMENCYCSQPSGSGTLVEVTCPML